MTQKELPLIMLHGALGNTRQLQHLAEILAHEHYVYLIEFEGHGGNPSQEEMSIHRFMENVIVAMNRDGLEKANFFGHSMGGYVALQLALEHPERVGKIFTLGTKFEWTSEFANGEKAKLDPKKILEKIPSYAQYLENMHHGADWREVVRQTGEMMVRMGEGERIHENDLKKIPVPVIVAVGELDKMVSWQETKKAAELLPNGKPLLIGDVVHPIDKVLPEQILPQLLEFLSEPIQANP
ncbi:MAG: alpha/beta hydrolase [Bacteroidota bacterium]|nr:alpha/beta hydrolase [Bacteroidota bacterium]